LLPLLSISVFLCSPCPRSTSATTSAICSSFPLVQLLSFFFPRFFLKSATHCSVRWDAQFIWWNLTDPSTAWRSMSYINYVLFRDTLIMGKKWPAFEFGRTVLLFTLTVRRRSKKKKKIAKKI
jgi:hypothetical protein